MLGLDEALEIVLSESPRLGRERVPLEASLGRVLARPVKAVRDLPPFDRATMDGVAVASSAIQGRPVSLKVSDTVLAGQPVKPHPGEGACVKIMTGAIAPRGTAAVVPIERCAFKEEQVVVCLTGKERTFVCPKGQDARRGDVLIQAGTRIEAPHWTVLSYNGTKTVEVGRRPSVGVASTGQEVVPLGLKPRPWQIADCNSWTLQGLLDGAGMAATAKLGILPDDETALCESIGKALDEHEAVLLSGGVSMGEKDLVTNALKRLGMKILFHRVAMRPGKPFLLAKVGRRLLFGLPGNPFAVWVCALLFVLPSLRRMAGMEPESARLRAKLGEELMPEKARTRFVPAWLTQETTAQWVALPTEYHGAGDVPSMSQGNALVLLKPGDRKVREGTTVDVVPYPRPFWGRQAIGVGNAR